MITALFMLPGIMMTIFVKEPTLTNARPRTLRAAIIEPFQEFIGRHGWRSAFLVLAFIFLYKLGDSMATALATPFYLDMGFSKTEIGLIAKNAGLWPSVIGGLLGGIWMVKLGINRALWLFGAVQMVAILGFAWLAVVGHDVVWLALVIGVEALGVGLGTAAFVAYIAKTTHPLYTATQFALFTSLAAVPRTLANAATGYLVEWLGWVSFFLLCFALAIPGMLLLLKVAPWKNEAS
jgi:PAT family beta-lactamase induction signal transducer AmpG